MIRLDIQMFAKTTSQMQQYRKSQAITKFAQEAKRQESAPKEETKRSQMHTPGESVSAVNMREQYEIFRIENGREIPVIRDGAQVIRTGREVVEKFTYNKRINAWTSNAKGYKYRIRKRRQ